MTTAPTPSEQVWRLSCALEIAAALPDMPQVTIPRIDALEAAAALQRLERENDRLRTERHDALCRVENMEPELAKVQAENERLRSAERTLQRLGYQDRGGQEWAPPIGQAPDFDLIDSLRSRIAELEASKNARIHELEMQAMDLASENSILKRAETDELEARKPLPPARVDELMAEAGYLGASAESRADFINGLRHAEAAHGITGGSS